MPIPSHFNAARHAVHRLWARMWSVLIFSLYAGLTIAQKADDASPGGGGNAPWESVLCNIAHWFQGPTPIAVGTIAFGVAGASFMFGEELTGILKKTVNITMGTCLSVGGVTFLGWIAEKTNAVACTV
ncbi:TrbC/VirB2 family protein [Candidatus Glomeribacter gigasporarum]|nr:TrbC/VirB2 family protein [Candidatus Glomeribacter gigasporarum]